MERGSRWTIITILRRLNRDLAALAIQKQPGHIYGSISACDAVGTYCGLTPGRYLHEGDSVIGDGKLGACMSLTAHRGAHELPGIVSSANDASASLAQCRDKEGQNKKPVQDADSDLSLPDKSGDACLFSVPIMLNMIC